MQHNYKKLIGILGIVAILSACAGVAGKTADNQVAQPHSRKGAAKNIESTDAQATAVIDTSVPTGAVKSIKSLDEEIQADQFPEKSPVNNTQIRSVVFRETYGGPRITGFLWGDGRELPTGMIPVVFRNNNFSIGIPLVSGSKQCCWSVIIPPHVRHQLQERLQNQDGLPALPALPMLSPLPVIPEWSNERVTTWWIMNSVQ